MLSQLDPRLVYYLELYLFVFLVRFLKLLPKLRNEFAKAKWHEVVFGSLDLVYASAGVAALLVMNERQWVEPLMGGWAILLVVSAFFDAQGDSLSQRTRVVGHSLVAIVVVVATVVAFQSLIPPREDGVATAPTIQEREFRVAIAYVDQSLNEHIGRDKQGNPKLGNRKLVWVTQVRSRSADSAAAVARRDFWDEKNKDVAPFTPGRPKSEYTIGIVEPPVVQELGQ